MLIKIKDAAKKFKGWSIYRLAKELNRQQQTVSSWANSRTQPSYEDIEKICIILGCTVNDLFEVEYTTKFGCTTVQGA